VLKCFQASEKTKAQHSFGNFFPGAERKMAERIPYGTGPFQFAELKVPTGSGPHPVAIVIHGGFWRAKYDLDYIRPVCDALTEAGLATWNIEYRRLGQPGGGWPGTLEDVAAGAHHLVATASRLDLDTDRIIALGHSAGGHLAMWLAARHTILRAVISLAGVVDLRRAWELHLGNDVVADFLGGSPDEFPDRYAFASPIEQLPIGVPQKLFHGTADANVPFEISERYVQAALRHSDDAELITLEGATHFDVVDLGKKEFAAVMAAAVTLVS
jgi:acetyl esterase/lipase